MMLASPHLLALLSPSLLTGCADAPAGPVTTATTKPKLLCKDEDDDGECDTLQTGFRGIDRDGVIIVGPEGDDHHPAPDWLTMAVGGTEVEGITVPLPGADDGRGRVELLDLPTSDGVDWDERRPLAALIGNAAGDGFGADVALTTWETDEGVAAVAIGAPGVDAGVDEDLGAVYFYGGIEDGEGSDVGPAAAAGRLTGEAGSLLGFSVAEVGGRGDSRVAIGAPGDSSLASGGGAVLVANTDALVTGSLDDAALLTAVGSWEGGRAGWLVTGADVDGDGVGDLLLSAPYADGVGLVAVVMGRAEGELDLADADLLLWGEDTRGRAGHSLDVATGPAGTAVLAVGAPAAADGAGAAWMIDLAGKSLGEGSLGDATAMVTGSAAGDMLGQSVGIYDGTDLLLGAPGAADGQGQLYLFVEAAGGLDPREATEAATTSASQGLGASLLTGLDWTGDGFQDAAVLADGRSEATWWFVDGQDPTADTGG